MSGFRVTQTGRNKRLHREGCRHGKHPYIYANQFGDDSALVANLVESGAIMWHLGCLACCPDLDAELWRARTAYRRYRAMLRSEGLL